MWRRARGNGRRGQRFWGGPRRPWVHRGATRAPKRISLVRAERKTTVNCPKCKAAMEIVVFEDIEVDRCTACKGLWFDSRENERLKSMRGSEIIDSGDPKTGRKNNTIPYVRCPRDGNPLIRMVDPAQPHLWYETCSTCGGAYFDAGEFRDYKNLTVLDFIKDLFAKPRA
ncbi:zf-TFIIB domain-containing protein [Polyangium jinanense]|uniref:Zf-TFIIB domain-containing protein n=1 Tax=Polyangium jinanense TaxID=2829994 RepID=A0A9X3X0Q8_9BACT|nr:zf-TFIIB domain-containing protein [Polyangium jinanense]MDC3980218.1 zf-TFIIB domain-containing protein [Polyangium jinanense]